MCNADRNGSELSCSDSWASALIAELDQFKNDKLVPNRLVACSVGMDMMDDFLEMERLAALPDAKGDSPFASSFGKSSSAADNNSMTQRVVELEKKLEKIEAEKNELESSLDESRGSLNAAQFRILEAENKLEELMKELKAAIEAKELLESHLVGMEIEARTMSADIDSLKAEIGKERKLSAELSVKCQELESKLNRTVQETVFQQKMTNPNCELKVKQDELAVAADKLAECQKTIVSLGMQLKSLATLEDFLIDTSNIPGFSARLSFNDSDSSKTRRDKAGNLENGSDESPPLPCALPASSAKSRNGFGKFFSRSKSVVEVDNRKE